MLDGLVLRSLNANHHGSIRGKSVAFQRSRAGLRRRHSQDIVPPGLALEVLARVNGGVLFAVGDVAIEEGFGGAFVDENCATR